MKTLFTTVPCTLVDAAGSDEELSGAESFIDGAGI